MNLWQCDALLNRGNKCTAIAYGVGGASGLTAIGWWFVPGTPGRDLGELLCPWHRPGGIMAAQQDADSIFRMRIQYD